MAEVDLFVALDMLFRGDKLEQGHPSPFIMHRFLAWDPDFASFARAINYYVRDPAMVYEVWRGAVPRLKRAPKLNYTGPKKEKGAEGLVLRIMEVEKYNRLHAEEAVQMLTSLGKVDEAKRYYGVE